MALSIEIQSALTAIQNPEFLPEEMAFLYAQNLHHITEERLTEELRVSYPRFSVESAAQKEFYFLDGVSLIGGGIGVDGEFYGLPDGKGYSLMMSEFSRVLCLVSKFCGEPIKEEEVFMRLAPLFCKREDAKVFLTNVRAQEGDVKKIGNVFRQFKEKLVNNRQGKEVHSILWEFRLIRGNQTKIQSYDSFKDNI